MTRSGPRDLRKLLDLIRSPQNKSEIISNDYFDAAAIVGPRKVFFNNSASVIGG
jgi:hypothetical protein